MQVDDGFLQVSEIPLDGSGGGSDFLDTESILKLLTTMM